LIFFAERVMPEFKARDEVREAEKCRELAPFIEAALARKPKMPPIDDTAVPRVEALGRKAPSPLLNSVSWRGDLDPDPGSTRLPRGSAALAQFRARMSGMRPADDPILKRFRAALDEIYGERLERVVLFGSRARDAREDSDYDVAVFLEDLTDRWSELNRLADLSTDILYETGEFIHAMPYRAGSYQERTPLMHEIRTDGIDL
jgi:predicted nucleotidyltransferase